MIRIAAILPSASYAPELYALKDYLSADPEIDFHLMPSRPAEGQRDADRYDAIYVKMGFAPVWEKSSVPEIHDYSSASTGSFRRTKDIVKSTISRPPILRSFLSKSVRAQFSFRDSVPYVIRDMGVPDEFLAARRNPSEAADFDLLYAGSISPSRRTADLFRSVRSSGLTLLAVGRPDPNILNEFKESKHITFAGSVPYAEIPKLARRCRFGVNYTPDIRPYSFQTSTKVLEYLALGLPVVTNDYAWVKDFELESGARMARLKDINALNAGTLDFEFKVPDMSGYSWTSIYDRSGIREALITAL